jgi:hypothetical protein
MIGDSRFVQAALEHDRLKRLTVFQRMNSGGTLEDIARTIADKMKLDVNQLRHRKRENDRSKFRKIFAASPLTP